ncbi:hypothetical protein [Candidatus Amarolinea dominans]
MSKRNQILAGILLAQVLLAVFVLWPRSAPRRRASLCRLQGRAT